MVSAIIYTSNTGFTARYAKMLGEKTGLPVFDLKGGKLPGPESEVVYLGWLMAGSVKDLAKALKKWNVRGVCAVGMGAAEGAQESELARKHPGLKVFYLEGGYDHGKQKGIFKMMMNVMRKAMEKRPADDPQARRILEAMKQPADWVREENLEPVLDWLKG